MLSEQDPSPTPVAVDDRPEGTPPGALEAEPGVASTRAPLSPAEIRWLVGIVAVAAVLRAAWLVFAHAEPPTHYLESGDQYSYWYHANEIAAGRGYHSYITGEVTAYYPIGYPAILAGLFWLAHRVPFVDPDLMLVAGTFHVVVSAATVALTFVVGRRLLGVRAGLVAAALMAVFPNLIYQVTALQLETTFVFFTLAALAVIVDHDWSSGPPSRNRLLVFGALLAASALIRPFSVPMLVGLLIAMLVAGTGWRKALLAVALPVAVLVVAFTPWTIRNAVELDAFVPSSTNMGDTLCIDRNLDAKGGFRWATHDGCVDADLPEVERNRGNTRKAIEFVVEHPGREVLQVVRRARLMFAEDHDGVLAAETMGSGPLFSDGTRSVLEDAGDWYFFVVVGAAALGFVWLVRRSPPPERWLVLAPLIAFVVIPLFLWGNPRFHLPLAPFFAVSAAALVTVRRRQR
jgi:4-amino-4-deoxy-L-arabinose transferase-like glycosyltransferase